MPKNEDKKPKKIVIKPDESDLEQKTDDPQLSDINTGNKPRYHRLSAEDVALQNRKRWTMVLFSVAGLLFACLLVLLFTVYPDVKNAKSAAAANETKISQLNDKLTALKAHKPQTNVDKARKQEAVMIKKGNELAQAQNAFNKIDIAKKKQLDPLVANVKMYLKNSDDYATPWYQTGFKNNPSTWSFATKFSFQGKQITTLFLNKDKRGQLLAFATATYLPDKQLFTDIKISTTDVGMKVHAADDNTRGKKEKEKRFKKTIKDVQKANKQSKVKGLKPKSAKAIAKIQEQERERYYKKHPNERPKVVTGSDVNDDDDDD